MGAIPESTLPGHRQLHERVVTALQLCQESRDVEFKGPGTWSELRYHIARTSLAMANLRDGGIIVIGVEERDGTWVLSGIDDECLATYDEDEVNDFINRYASPPMRLELVKVTHRETAFLTIRISEFERTPIVCKRAGPDSTGLRRGVIYVRPVGKPQTSQVNDANELEDLLDLASEKRARRLLQAAARVGMQSRSSVQEAFDKELDGL